MDRRWIICRSSCRSFATIFTPKVRQRPRNTSGRTRWRRTNGNSATPVSRNHPANRTRRGWLNLGDQFDAFLPSQIARVLSGGRVIPVLMHAQAGQRAAAVGIVNGAGRRLGRLRRFVEIVVRVAANLGSAGEGKSVV